MTSFKSSGTKLNKLLIWILPRLLLCTGTSASSWSYLPCVCGSIWPQIKLGCWESILTCPLLLHHSGWYHLLPVNSHPSFPKNWSIFSCEIYHLNLVLGWCNFCSTHHLIKKQKIRLLNIKGTRIQMKYIWPQWGQMVVHWATELWMKLYLTGAAWNTYVAF